MSSLPAGNGREGSLVSDERSAHVVGRLFAHLATAGTDPIPTGTQPDRVLVPYTLSSCWHWIAPLAIGLRPSVTDNGFFIHTSFLPWDDAAERCTFDLIRPARDLVPFTLTGDS